MKTVGIFTFHRALNSGLSCRRMRSNPRSEAWGIPAPLLIISEGWTLTLISCSSSRAIADPCAMTGLRYSICGTNCGCASASGLSLPDIWA